MEAEEKELLYDLRQAFVLITTKIKEHIVVARAEKNFQEWNNWIDSLFIEVSKNLSNKEMKEFEKLQEESAKIFNKCSSTFLGRSSKNQNEVYQALRKLDIWVNRKMNEKNMYGSRDADDGL